MSIQLDQCLGACSIPQILNINMAVNSVDEITVYDHCDSPYDVNNLLYSYSLDGACYSCYMKYADVVTATLDNISDFFVRIKVKGAINKVELNGEAYYDYTTSLESKFELTTCGDENSSTKNLYNPYANLDCAITLQQSLAETVACVVGIPIFYFKVNGVPGAADMTFKEYALKSVVAVKQIKLIVQDG